MGLLNRELRLPVLLPTYIMSSHKIKKLTLQYAYLSLEKEEIDEKCQDAEAQIRSYIEKNCPNQYKQIYDSPAPSTNPRGNKKGEETEEEIRVEEEAPPSVTPKNKELKKLMEFMGFLK